MNLTFGFSVAALLIGFGGLLFGVLNWKNQREARRLLEFLAKQNEDLEKALEESKTVFASDRAKVSEHARKIVWLETRIRKPNLLKVEKVEAELEVPTEAQKPNITERRHRVLKLAALGQDAKTIASTLGMMSGEVELIITLNRQEI